jgi:hypothetical protein
MIDHELAKAFGHQRLHQVHDEGFAADSEQWLRHIVG